MWRMPCVFRCCDFCTSDDAWKAVNSLGAVELKLQIAYTEIGSLEPPEDTNCASVVTDVDTFLCLADGRNFGSCFAFLHWPNNLKH